MPRIIEYDFHLATKIVAAIRPMLSPVESTAKVLRDEREAMLAHFPEGTLEHTAVKAMLHLRTLQLRNESDAIYR